MHKYILPIEPPPTHQAALRILKTRDGRQFIGKMAKSSAKKWAVAATLMLSQQREIKQAQTIDAPCIVSLTFYYPHTKESEKFCKRTNQTHIAKSTRPDLDNLAKSVLDAMVDAGVLKDDGAIVELALAKYYAAEPKVVVDIDVHPVFDS